MKRVLSLLFIMFALNGCAESIALLGTSAGGLSSGKVVQSSIHTVTSFGVKKQTGKTPLGHALAYAEKVNPEKNKEPCLDFIEKTNSEVCAIIKKQISSTKAKLLNNKKYNKPLNDPSSLLKSNIDKKSKIKYLD